MAEPIPKYYGPIAVLDMLGFKKYVENNTLDKVISNYAHELTGASFTSEVLKENLQFMVYSDTVAIRLVNQTDEGFYNFINALHIICSSYLYKLGIPGFLPIPIRGAIAVGEYSWYNGDISTQAMGRQPIVAKQVNFIVGKAIISAHEHEKIQQWIGVSMNMKTAEIVSNLFPNAFSKLKHQGYLLNCDIPLKTSSVPGFVVNPTIRSEFKRSFEELLKISEQIFLSQEELYCTKLKYYNTLKLLKKFHEDNNLIPVFKDLTPKEIENHNDAVDKNRYTELIKYFEENLK